MTAAGRTVLPNVHVPARGHVRALTGLRAVAVLWVVAFTFRGTGGSGWSAFYEPLRPLVDNGWLGVDLLFVLGGFVLTSDHLQDMGRRPRLSTVIAFYRDRLARVWPLYAVVVLGFAAWLVVKHVLGGGAHVHEPIQPKLDLPHLVEQLLMAQIWHRPYQDGGMIVLPTWALSAAGLAVVVFPLLVLLAWRLRTWPPLVTGAGAVAVLLPFAYVAFSEGTHAYAWSWLLRISGCFIAGMLTCLCVLRIDPGARTRRWTAVVAWAAVGEVLVMLWWAHTQGDRGGVAVLLFPVLIGALALSDSGLARPLSHRWMVLGGQISFALYLVHSCVFEVFWTAMDALPSLRPDSPLAMLLTPVVLVLPLPVAYLLWRHVEEPARKRLTQVGPQRAAAPGRSLPPAPRHTAAGAATPVRLRAAEDHRPEPAGPRRAALEEG